MKNDDLDMPQLATEGLEREPLIAEPSGQGQRLSLRNKKVVFILSGLVLGAGSALWLTVANSGDRAKEEPKAHSEAKVSAKVFNSETRPSASLNPQTNQCVGGQRPAPVKSSDGVPLSTEEGLISICPDGSIITLPVAASSPANAELSTQLEPSPPTYPNSVASIRKSTAPKKSADTSLVPDPLLLTRDGVEQFSPVRQDMASEAPFLPVSEGMNTTDTIRATRLATRDYLLPEGRMIECALSVRLVSELAGKAVCVLTRAVYSDTGRVRLLEQGSEVLGEYRALSSAGQTRLMVQWTRIRSPTGVVVRLQADATDSLGAAGLEGRVQSHWWTRIGSAFLLSTVQDVVAGAANNSSGDEIVLRNTTATSRTMAEKVLDQSIDIPPTFYRRQGDRALIYVNRDVDFRDVYVAQSR